MMQYIFKDLEKSQQGDVVRFELSSATRPMVMILNYENYFLFKNGLPHIYHGGEALKIKPHITVPYDGYWAAVVVPLLSAVKATILIDRKREEQDEGKVNKELKNNQKPTLDDELNVTKEDNKSYSSETQAENLNKQNYSVGGEILENSELNEMLERMTKAYKDFRIFEEITRNFLRSTLEEEIGDDWWNKVIDNKLIKKVTDRKKQDDKNKWHSNRGHCLISFIDFNDLCKIITSHKSWEFFKEIFPSIDWVKSIFVQLEPSRNTVMHAGELDKRDIERIIGLMSDWYKQIGQQKEQEEK